MLLNANINKWANYDLIRPVCLIFVSKLIVPLNEVDFVTGMLHLTREKEKVSVFLENEQFIFLWKVARV